MWPSWSFRANRVAGMVGGVILVVLLLLALAALAIYVSRWFWDLATDPYGYSGLIIQAIALTFGFVLVVVCIVYVIYAGVRSIFRRGRGP